MSENTVRIVPIKFRDAGKQYDFNAHGLELRKGERVVVETDRGRALGTVVLPPREVPRDEAPGSLKSVLRPATEDDLALAATNASREGDAFRFCQRRIEDRKMEMKLVRAEYLFDGSKIIFYFTADGRVDFRELVKDLAHYFHTRIEMRQIGVRDEAKLTGGIGICGRELCCCTFLTDFTPVSVKMAKEQGLALNPNKISGQCGRLLCCLGYEYETYCGMRKGLPKCGRKVQTPEGEGEVVDLNVLAQNVTVRLGDGQRVTLSADLLTKGGGPETQEPRKPRQQKGEGRPEGRRPRRPPRDGAAKEAPQRPEKAPPKEAAPPAAEGDKPKDGKKRSRRRRRPRRKEQ